MSRCYRRYRPMLRAALVVAVLAAVLGFILTSCPANRDGAPGQLAAAKEEVQSATRSAALSVSLWSRGRTTRNLVSVQLADARDEAVKAYRGIATLKAVTAVDADRQRLLTQSTNELIDMLNSAIGAVRDVSGQPDPEVIRRRLLEAADQLEREYR